MFNRSKAFIKKLFSCGIFIDLRKAFDTDDHSILLSKLNHYGIRGIVNDWFSSCLFKCTQTTEINSFIFDKEIAASGVLLRSVLGPLLFVIFINDIPNSSQKLNLVLFAGDTNVLYADKHPKSLEETVNKELKNVCEWLHVNKLTLNIKKLRVCLGKSGPVDFA